MMFHKKTITQVVRLALMGGAAASALAMPFASAVTEEEHDVDPVERISVTGTRIMRANNVTTSPILAISAAEIKATGITRIEDYLNEMPQIVAAQNSTVANGSDGTATVDLRGLGDNRTLVLVNGRRLPAGSVGGSSAADLNNIPTNMIERVEILTGGSSATYGADAVAGVVNFILKRDFEGFEFDYQYSFYQHDNNDNYMQNLITSAGYEVETGNVTDGDTDNFSMRLGANSADGNGNVTMYALYRKVDAVLNGNRDYSGCALGGTYSAKECAGSATSPSGTFTSDFETYYTVSGNEFVEGLSLYNYGPLNYYQRPDENKLLGATGFYEINEHAEVYAEVSMMDDRTVAQIAPSGDFFATSTINCDNSMMTTAQQSLFCTDPGTATTADMYIGRRNVEGGPRQDDIRHTTYRGVLGVRGNINDEWSYDAFANYGTVSYVETYYNDMSNTRIARALDVVSVDGVDTCQSAVDGYDTDCVPWDIFTEGGVTQAAIDYLVLPLYSRGDNETIQLSSYVYGDMTDAGWTLPTASTGLAIVGGLEYRSESVDYSPDANYQSGDGAGQGGPSTALSGSYHVMDYYVEANLPILEDKFLAEELVFEGAYRFSDYSTDNQTNTYKLGLNWKLNDQVRVRASLQHAVRSPNLDELYSANGLVLFNWTSDPCSTSSPQYSEAQCASTGVTSAQYGSVPESPAGQYNQYAGGNTALDPESSNTVAIGLILTPEFLENFSISFDYFDISIDDAIDEVAPADIVELCAVESNAEMCSYIHRNTTTGDLWVGSTSTSGYVTSTYINTGNLSTKGVDTDINYLYETGMGDVRFNLLGTYLDSYTIQNITGGTKIECAGEWDRSTCEAVRPKWRHVMSTTWATPWDVNLTGRWRYIGEADERENADNDPMNYDAVNYIDLSGSWQATEYLNFQLGVNNVFDKTPQVMTDGPAGESNGNTWGGLYDVLGRYIYIGGTVVF
ncbi:TonB-dependent receptor domain-containing protein [Shewanella surugensis]|uniref:TonB-dependent receptor n=1 Tax=Shewanella surugensis TaxID=212020 RepID=A0ABT0L8M5_9GAMM|nr:TonB-dependent receptor [Shewanella surugensis]MCL1123909.1 TonB-dependent receptor [Shewanella surugensis]